MIGTHTIALMLVDSVSHPCRKLASVGLLLLTSSQDEIIQVRGGAVPSASASTGPRDGHLARRHAPTV